MRALLLALSILIAMSAPSLASPRNAYTSLPRSDAAACARACADDGLCIAWTYSADNICALSANSPVAWPDGAEVMGLSVRAPPFASIPARPESLTAPVAGRMTPTETAMAADFALLGGPDEGVLRPRLGVRQ